MCVIITQYWVIWRFFSICFYCMRVWQTFLRLVGMALSDSELTGHDECNHIWKRIFSLGCLPTFCAEGAIGLIRVIVPDRLMSCMPALLFVLVMFAIACMDACNSTPYWIIWHFFFSFLLYACVSYFGLCRHVALSVTPRPASRCMCKLLESRSFPLGRVPTFCADGVI